MRIFDPLLLLLLRVVQSASTQAADLNGGWALESSACDKVFTKENNKLAFKPDAESLRGRFDRRWKENKRHISKKCIVKSLHDDGSNVQVIAACSDGVAVSDTKFDVKILGENKITLSSKEPVPGLPSAGQ